MNTTNNFLSRSLNNVANERKFLMMQLSRRLMMSGTILALLITACTSPISTSQQDSSTANSVPGESTPTPLDYGMVDVGGYELWFTCIGQGTPTVILEAGASSGAGYWIQVQTGGERGYRVCSYDRANLKPSDRAPKPRTYLDMTRDLHALLVNAQIDGPYILVGHSGGGLIARFFTDQYPEEVVGLVLVDSAHPDMGVRLLASLPPRSMFEPKIIRFLRQWFTWMSDSSAANYPFDSEGMDMLTSNAQIQAVKPLGDLPLVVISRNPNDTSFTNAGVNSDLPAETTAKLMQTWQDMQNELVDWSSNSTQVIARGGHDIPTDEPELIVDAIRDLVYEYRAASGETNPSVPPANQTGALIHTPMILGAEERQETNEKGNVINYIDITFTDTAGDATTIVNKVISFNNPDGMYPFLVDDNILVSAEEQKSGVVVTSPLGCLPASTYVMEYRILDQAGSMSEPVTFTISCPASQNKINLYLIIGCVIGLVLLGLVAWLLIRNRRARWVATTPE